MSELIWNAILDDTLPALRVLGGQILSGRINSPILPKPRLQTMVKCEDLEGSNEFVVPSYLFDPKLFHEGDQFVKQRGDLFAQVVQERDPDVGEDWEYLWGKMGDRAFAERYWESYVAVFQRHVWGHGITDPEARNAAVVALAEGGRRDVPAGRLVVGWVGFR